MSDEEHQNFQHQLEQFNEHQADVRKRADSLAKAIFLIAGGSLTVSIGLFTNDKAPTLEAPLKAALKLSWGLLTASIISLVLMLSIVLLRDYFFGEKWRASFDDETIDGTNKPGSVETLIIIAGISGVLLFITGIALQAYVAIAAL
jgi:hypothetical protein